MGGPKRACRSAAACRECHPCFLASPLPLSRAVLCCCCAVLAVGVHDAVCLYLGPRLVRHAALRLAAVPRADRLPVFTQPAPWRAPPPPSSPAPCAARGPARPPEAAAPRCQPAGACCARCPQSGACRGSPAGAWGGGGVAFGWAPRAARAGPAGQRDAGRQGVAMADLRAAAAWPRPCTQRGPCRTCARAHSRTDTMRSCSGWNTWPTCGGRTQWGDGWGGGGGQGAR